MNLKGMARFAGPFLLLATTLSAEPLDLSKGRIPFVPSLSALFQVSQPVSGIQYTAPGGTFSGGTITIPILAADGTNVAPSFSFSGLTTGGMWRTGSQIGLQATNALILNINTTQAFFSGSASAGSATTPVLSGSGGNAGLFFPGGTTVGLTATGGTTQLLLGSGTDSAPRLFGGAAPTISSGFGTSPSVVAGGVNGLFQVNVGTGGTATSGVVAFHGTWTNAPKCFANDETTADAAPTHAVTTTSQVTLSISTAWATGTLVDVFCISN